MSLSEENMPSRKDGDNNNNGDGKRRNNDTKISFDLLRLKLLENQRIAEQQRSRKSEQVSRPRWNGNDISSPSSMANNSPIQTVRSRSFQASSTSFETADKVDRMSVSAREELLRLGRRYTSQQRIMSSHTSLQSPADGSSANPATEIGNISPPLESRDIHISPRYLDIDSRSYSTPLETSSHHGGLSVVTPDEKNTSNEEIGVYGSHYLLLARKYSPPRPTLKIDCHAGDINIVADDEDGSSSASYNTPAPHLQAASACNSHGENEDGCDDNQHAPQQEDDQEKLDHFSSFCRAQVLISEIEHNSSRQLEEVVVPICPSVADEKKDNPWQSHGSYVRRIIYFVAQSALVVIVGAVIYFSWRYISGWYKLTYGEMSPAMLLSAQWHSWLHSMQKHHKTLGIIRRAIYSRMLDGLEQYVSLHDYFTSRLLLWAKFVWSTPVAIYRDWREDVDLLSWTIEVIYRLEKLYYDTLQLFNTTKFRFLEVWDSSPVVWNMTLSMAVSCWRNLKSGQLSHATHSLELQDSVMVRTSTLTAPLVFQSSDGCLSNKNASQNETLVSLSVEFSSPQFWRGINRGTPFVRHQSSPIRHRRIHSIPSLGSQVEADYVPISISPALNGLWHPNGRSNLRSFPMVGLRRSYISLEKSRLDSFAISSDIRRNIAAWRIMQRSSPPQHSEHFTEQKRSQEITIEKRNYYESSYPPQKQSHEKDVFDDVDVAAMTREFVGKLWQRRSSTKGGDGRVQMLEIHQ